jgi:hypothetical protein
VAALRSDWATDGAARRSGGVTGKLDGGRCRERYGELALFVNQRTCFVAVTPLHPLPEVLILFALQVGTAQHFDERVASPKVLCDRLQVWQNETPHVKRAPSFPADAVVDIFATRH